MLSWKAVFVVIGVIVNSFHLYNCDTNCIIFKKGGEIIRARKGSYETLTFSVPSRCYPPEASGIDSISVYNVTSGSIGQSYCQLLVTATGQCRWRRPQDCFCRPEAREYTINLQTSAQTRCEIWQLAVGFAGTGASVSTRVKLLSSDPSDLYPPKVKSISTQVRNGGTPLSPLSPLASTVVVEPGSRFEFSCLWEDGNPPQTARLTRAAYADNEMSLTAIEQLSWRDDCLRHLIYVIEKVQCSDMARITCRVAGATTNMSRVLLVKCPPEFQTTNLTFALPSSGHLALTFPVRVHERNISTCRLVRRVSGESTPAVSGEKSGESVPCYKPELAGEWPNLVLKTSMTIVTSAAAGEWTLELNNSGGAGSVDFYVEERKVKFPLHMIASATGCAVICVMVAIVGCLVQCRRKARCREPPNTHPSLPTGSALEMRPPVPVPRKVPQETPDEETVYHVCESSIDGAEAADCDSCLIDRIYNEIKEHAIRCENP